MLNSESDIMFPNNSNIRFVTRSEWIAQPPNDILNDLELPATRVIIAHTATEGCSAQVRMFSEFGIKNIC